MLRYFNSRELAGRFGIHLAKWKRWSREFLPPDPLGGLQSGYARQFHPDQAFAVCLGGFLVGQFNFSIPEARRILADLDPLLHAGGFFFEIRAGAEMDGSGWSGEEGPLLIFITKDPGGEFAYRIRRLISRTPTAAEDEHVFEERFSETLRNLPEPSCALDHVTGAWLFNATRFLKQFITALELDPGHYRTACRPDTAARSNP